MREPLDLVRSVDDDAPDAKTQGRPELVVGLRVAVQLRPGHREARALRRQELAERRGARIGTHPRQDGRDAAKAAGLDRVRHPDRAQAFERNDVAAVRVPDRRRVVHVERGAEALRERDEIDIADAQPPAPISGRLERPDRGVDQPVPP